MGSGGARIGSGRKPSNVVRTQMNIRVTDSEKKAILVLLEQLRKVTK